MNYKIEVLPAFEREFKRLSKKYRSLKDDYAHLIEELHKNPHAGVEITPCIRKVRMAIKSKGKGKSHGARVITVDAVVNEEEGILYLLYVYDKEEVSSVRKDVLIQLAKEYLE